MESNRKETKGPWTVASHAPGPGESHVREDGGWSGPSPTIEARRPVPQDEGRATSNVCFPDLQSGWMRTALYPSEEIRRKSVAQFTSESFTCTR